MKILISNTSKVPLYQQIIDQIKEQIRDGTLKEGDPLLSIRLLARDLQISVITSKRAYEELEKEGYIYSTVGKGSFVAAKEKYTENSNMKSILKEKLIVMIQECKNNDVKKEELIHILELIYGEES
ncbi:GntR family transcriptional regulator [Bacillus cereus]|uniref:GntR family transcriptional regulator n=1 Tax=Bacillus cereus TaxID=1396 RepID=UPI0018CED232|nr:GntR family transcriptional regulator [Bacillus cereus]MBG9713100.1 GntR family transcriptional regulator [Bacillus cereus]